MGERQIEGGRKGERQIEGGRKGKRGALVIFQPRHPPSCHSEGSKR